MIGLKDPQARRTTSVLLSGFSIGLLGSHRRSGRTESQQPHTASPQGRVGKGGEGMGRETKRRGKVIFKSKRSNQKEASTALVSLILAHKAETQGLVFCEKLQAAILSMLTWE